MTNTFTAPRPRVLLVEDDRDVAAVVCLALEDLFEVIHAATAQSARSLIRSACPALVLLDWCLGSDSGQEVLAELELISPAHRPAVIITSGGEEEVYNESLRRGLACRLPKPYSLEDLVKMVTLQLGLRTRQQEGHQ